MNTPSLEQIKSATGVVLSFGLGVVATAGTMHVIPDADSVKSLSGALNQIAGGVVNIATGVSTLALAAVGAWRWFETSPFAQILGVTKMINQPTAQVKQAMIASVSEMGGSQDDVAARQALIDATAKNPDVQRIVASKEIAETTPSAKVISTSTSAKQLIERVAALPEVSKIVAPGVADDISSHKVVAQ